VFFFSPDTNVNNFSTLKGEFDSCFATAGNHKFQPFADRAAFEAALKEKRAGLFLMSSRHFAQISRQGGSRPRAHWRVAGQKHAAPFPVREEERAQRR
jgi:hypothetical protein